MKEVHLVFNSGLPARDLCFEAKSIVITILLTFVLVVSATGQPQPRTVTEFYLALPGGIYGIQGTQDSEIPGFENDFFFYANERNESTPAIRTYRKSLIKIEDIKNGYLRLESKDGRDGRKSLFLRKRTDPTSLQFHKSAAKPPVLEE